MPKAWRRVSEEVLFRNTLWGKEVIKAVFENPFTRKKEEFLQFNSLDFAQILPLTSNKEVVAVCQFKQGCNGVITEIPGGTIKRGELPEQVAKRELEEETGYRPQNCFPLGLPLWVDTRHSRTRCFLFLGTGCQKIGEPDFNPHEEIEVKLIPLKDWVEMAQTSIENWPSVVATFRAIPLL